MKVFVINLDKDKDRMASVDAQLRKLGVDYERVSGVHAKEMPIEERNRAVNRFRWWCAIGRPIVPAEIGCALSHYNIYRSMKNGEVFCILEDDVMLTDDFPIRLKEIESFVDVRKPQVIMLSSHNRPQSGTGIVRSRSAMCTDAYVITQSAAKALIKANLPMQVPCDHWWRWESKGLIELYHALPISVEQDQDQFGTSTQQNAVQVSSYPPFKWITHKIKRLLGKTFDLILLRLEL